MRITFKAAMALFLLGGVAQAADLEPELRGSSGGYYGNAYLGLFGAFTDGGGDTVRVPGIMGGGKIAYDGDVSEWGWQADTGLAYVNLDWISPDVNGVKGHLLTTDSALHVTYRPTNGTKIGLYGGLGTITLGLDDVSIGSVSLFSLAGITEASLTLAALGAGVEGLTELSDSTWIQGRLGLVDPYSITAEASDGVTTESVRRTDFLGDMLGFNAGGSIHHRVTDNIVARAEGSYTLMGIKGAPDLGYLNVGLGANYVFDSMPLAVGVTGTYSVLSFDGDSQDAFGASTRLTYSFGGPSQGSAGKLFRSGATGLNPN